MDTVQMTAMLIGTLCLVVLLGVGFSVMVNDPFSEHLQYGQPHLINIGEYSGKTVRP